MRLGDYLRLGAAGVLAHKKRAILVVAISGLLFSVVIAMFTLLDGFQSAVYAEEYKATNGKILYKVAFDEEYCEVTGCQAGENERGEMLALVWSYGGEVMEDVRAYETSEGLMYAVKPEVVAGVINKEYEVPEGAVPAVVSADVVGGWLQMTDGMMSSMRAKVKVAEEVREKAIGVVITPKNRYAGPEDELESEEGKTKFFVEGLLPGPVGNTSLALGGLTGTNPLDVIFDSVHLGWGSSLILQEGNLDELLGEPVEMENEVWVSFSNRDKAYEFATDKVNDCDEADRFFGSCAKGYKYRVQSAWGNFREMEGNLRIQWLIFSIVGLVIGVIAAIIMLTTFARIIGQDKKVIALYQATGATAGQVRKTYLVYLLMLSVMAAVFALVVGIGLALVMNLINLTAISEVFMMGFGAARKTIWVIGWNWRMLVVMLAIILVAPVSIVLAWRKFGAGKVARGLR